MQLPLCPPLTLSIAVPPFASYEQVAREVALRKDMLTYRHVHAQTYALLGTCEQVAREAVSLRRERRYVEEHAAMEEAVLVAAAKEAAELRRLRLSLSDYGPSELTDRPPPTSSTSGADIEFTV